MRQWKKRLRDRGGLYENGVGRRQKRRKFDENEADNPERLSHYAKQELRDKKRRDYQLKIDELREKNIPVTVTNLVEATGLSVKTVWTRLRLCGLKYRKHQIVALISHRSRLGRMKMCRQQLILFAQNKMKPEDIWFSDECKMEFTGSKVSF